jgi:hypothetical protein
MRWNRTIVQPYLDLAAVMGNASLEAAFRRRAANGRFRSGVASPVGFRRQTIALNGR